MTSWRDSASEEAQADLDGLLNAALGFAQQQLAQHGEFFPFAVAVRADGQVGMIAAHPRETDHPASGDVIASCVAVLTARQNEFRAGGVVADVRLPDLGSDAVEVALEHADGQALRVQLPYSKRRFRKDIDYGQLRAAPATRRIWSTS